MDQGNFESSIKEKFENAGQTPSSKVWTGINSRLNEQAVFSYRSAQKRYRWVAVAAVFLAFLSFVLQLNFQSDKEISASSYNALLPPSENHFHFFEPEVSVPHPKDQNSWSNIIFIEPERSKRQSFSPSSREEVREHKQVATNNLDKRLPEVALATIPDGEASHYYIAQYRGEGSFNNVDETSFWAGVEAGAGNFNPRFSGSVPLSANPNFEAIASNIDQSGFVNPTSTASQNGMEDGVMTSIGIDFGLKVGNKWTLESGVQYASVSNTSSATLSITDVYTISHTSTPNEDGFDGPDSSIPSGRQTEVERNTQYSLDLQNRMRFTSIPLKAGYFILDKKLSLRVNAGMAANYFLSNRLTDPTGQLESTNENNLYNEWSFDGLTGLEFGYNMFDNFNFTVESNYIRSVTPLGKSSANRSGFMVQTGVRYRLK